MLKNLAAKDLSQLITTKYVLGPTSIDIQFQSPLLNALKWSQIDENNGQIFQANFFFIYIAISSYQRPRYDRIDMGSRLD